MRVGKLELALLCGVLSVMNNVAWGDTAVNTVSTASTKSFLDVLSERGTLNYFGVYRGAPLSDLGNSLQPGTNGVLDPTSPQSIENLVTAGYKLNKDLMVGAVAHFFYFPIGNPAGSGQSLQMLDPLFILSKSNLVNVGAFKLSGRLNVVLPMSSADSLKSNNLAISISPTFNATYSVPNTNLTLGVFGYFKGYIANAGAAANVPTYKLYVAPNLNYQITQTVAATLWVDLVQATRRRGTGVISGLTNGIVDIEPGINWDINKYISFNPILNIYPATPTLAATSIQAILVAKAF